MKKVIIRLTLLIVLGGASWLGYRFYRQFDQKQQVIPTTPVRRSDVIIRSYTRGELRAVRSAMLIAPNLFGTVQITRLAPLGAMARDKDLIVEFDDSEVRSRLDEKQLQLDQLDEQLKKAQAELEIRNNQDQVELLRARFAVRRAELEVQRNELLSSIDATKNKLNLDEARRRLKQLESDIKSRLEQSQAELAVLRANKSKALLELDREKERLRQVRLLAPMSGLVAIRQARPMGMFFRGMQLPDLREGDQVFPGTPVADVLDLSDLELSAKVGELDRANLREGQAVSFRLDALPEQVFHGEIKSLSGTASANIWSGDVAKKFDVVFSVDMKELMTGLGAKPEQIRSVLETAARNRNKPVMPPMGGGPPVMMAAGGAGATGGDGGPGAAQAEGGERARWSGGMRGGPGGEQRSPEQQQKMREIFQKALAGRDPQSLTPEERQKMGEQIRAAMQKEGISRPGSGREGQAGAGAPRTVGFTPPGGEAGGQAGAAPMAFSGASRQQFSEKDLENAALPAPPEEDSQLNVLLRPGLLADVEIIVEKVPNAIHIPVQAVFEKEGIPIVYVKKGSRFDERPIKPLKRSESVLVIASGVEPGELVALADPTKGEKKGKQAGGGKKGGVPAPGAPASGGNR